MAVLCVDQRNVLQLSAWRCYCITQVIMCEALSFNNNTVMPLNLQYKSWRSLTAYCTAPLSARCFFLWLVSRLKGATGYLIITTVEPLFVTLPRLVQQDNLHT